MVRGEYSRTVRDSKRVCMEVYRGFGGDMVGRSQRLSLFVLVDLLRQAPETRRYTYVNNIT